MAMGRKTGGRRKGVPNKATAEIREHAQQYTVEALEGLAQIARTWAHLGRHLGMFNDKATVGGNVNVNLVKFSDRANGKVV